MAIFSYLYPVPAPLRVSTQPRSPVSTLPLLALLCVALSAPAVAQSSSELPAAPGPRPILQFSGIPIQPATDAPLPLGIDDAIDRGTQHNLQVLLAQQDERTVHGQILSVGNSLLPNLTASASTNASEINLAAMGFKPSSLAGFGIAPGSFSEIVKVDTTGAQLSLDQVLFSLPDYYLYRAAQNAESVARMNTLNAIGNVVAEVATQYLAALADQAQIANAQALVEADQEVLRQANLSHLAGVGTNLDVLRARVQLQTEQQTVVRAQDIFAKDKIGLNRLIGLPAGQQITLTDTVPYAEFAAMPREQALAIAFQRRKDLLALQAQLAVAERTSKAVKFERAPSLSFSGYYGVLGQTHGLYHGVFTAQGTLKIPIFEEARFRGETAVTTAQQIALNRQIDSLKITIDEQIRASMLDVQSSAELVKVATSNVQLARQELSDATLRFTAGVSDNLPVVQAQASLAHAQSRLISTQFQYNIAKLNLARNTGVVESRYKEFLGR